MPAYDICYMDEDGTLSCAFTVRFDSEMRAKILAHAMKPADCQRLEVWNGRELVYSRGVLDERRPMAQTPRHEPSNLGSFA